MYGAGHDAGVVPRLAGELLGHAGGQPIHFTVIELHNDTLVDLLAPRVGPGVGGPGPTRRLEVRGGLDGTLAVVDGAREVVGTSLTVILAAVRSALARRQVAATAANATSSRSHVIVSFSIGEGRLTLVDFAGLERVKRSGAEGAALREAQKINQSLFSLSTVVDAFRRGSGTLASVARSSRLARLLCSALGGGVDSIFMVCVSPELESCDESVSALCFADRVRRIPSVSGGGPARATSAPPRIF